jgi:hypothetical protein
LKKIDLRQTLGILANIGVLISGNLVAQEPSFVLGDTYVYGTERFDADAVRSEFERIAVLMSSSDPVEAEAEGEEITNRITEDLRSRGPFSYLAMDYGFNSFNNKVTVSIDVVEEADADRRMPFRDAPTGNYPEPGGLFEQWEEYERIAISLMMSGSLPQDAECPVLHCIGSFNHPDLMPYLASFNEGARANEKLLYEIAEGARDGRDREVAILLLAHTNDADRLMPLLGRAIYDPAQGVRNYAMRVMLYIAQNDSEDDYPVHDLIAALDFPTVTDRNKSAYTLLALAASPRYREVIRRNALPTLLQLLRTGPPINFQPAYELFKELSGEDFSPRDYAAWEQWVLNEQ